MIDALIMEDDIVVTPKTKQDLTVPDLAADPVVEEDGVNMPLPHHTHPKPATAGTI